MTIEDQVDVLVAQLNTTHAQIDYLEQGLERLQHAETYLWLALTISLVVNVGFAAALWVVIQ